MGKPTGHVFNFSGEYALERTTEFMVRISNVNGVSSYWRTGNSVRVNYKPGWDPSAKLTPIWSSVKSWKPKK